ncbi:hypothetical protein FE257_007237 [Aspergillus nanangensis]|uniref:Uncharacterized protein n=1 Tax=Aspergillus nanangensis TaxID=2582783 RepID=A0AAD4GUA2_ASPNN|nr:hypothetical protein FE257_007237 [Aspergillus nanangensis]
MKLSYIPCLLGASLLVPALPVQNEASLAGESANDDKDSLPFRYHYNLNDKKEGKTPLQMEARDVDETAEEDLYFTGWIGRLTKKKNESPDSSWYYNVFADDKQDEPPRPMKESDVEDFADADQLYRWSNW